MHTILNTYFNFPDEPEYYFYILNFGPFQQFQDFIRLNYVTCLSGPNGSGKSSLLDAVKACIIANRRYLSFNPKGGRETELNDYLNLFYSREKFGPTLLVFAVKFPTERQEYTEAIFGIGWENDPNGTMFYKENLSKKKALPLIKNALSVKDFLRKLKEPTRPGILHTWTNAVHYHRFLDEQDVFFFFPKDYEDYQSYHDLLRLLDASTRALTSTERLKISDLKKHLFRSHKDKKELEDSLNQIDTSLNLFFEYHTEREKQQTKLSAINHLLEAYQQYYELIEAENTAVQLLSFDKTISVLKEQHESLESHQNRLETSLGAQEERAEDLRNKISYKKSESKQFDNLYNSWDECHTFYADNEEVFKIDAQVLALDIQNLEARIESINKRVRSASATLKRFTTLLENSKNELRELETNRDKQLEQRKTLQNRQKEYQTRLQNLNEDHAQLKTLLKSLKHVKQTTNQLNSHLLQLGLEDRNTLSPTISKLQKEIIEAKQQLKEIHKQISLVKESLEKKISTKKAMNIIRNQFGLKQFFEYYDECPFEILTLHESVFQNIKDFFVIPASRREILPKVLKISHNEKISLLVLKNSDSLLKTIKVEERYDGRVIGRILDEQAIFYAPKISTPRYFGHESRVQFLKVLETEQQGIQTSAQTINSQMEEYEGLQNQYKVNSLQFEETTENVKALIGERSPTQVLKSTNEEIQDINKKIKDIYTQLSQIPKEGEFEERKSDLKEEIETHKKTVQSWQEDHEQLQKEFKSTQNELTIKKKQLETFPEIFQKGQQILSELIDMVQPFFPNLNFQGLTYLKTLEQIKGEILPKRETIRDELERLKTSSIHIESRINENKKELEEITLEIKNKEEDFLKQKQEKESLLQLIFDLFHQRLVEEVTLHPDNFTVWFNQCIDNAIERVKALSQDTHLIEQNIQKKKISFNQRWDEAIQKACLAFNVSSGNLLRTDEYGRCTLTYLMSAFNIDLHTLTIKEHLFKKIQQLDQKLEETCSHFIADSSAFIGLISEELKKFRQTAMKYNRMASVARFGTLGRIIFELKYRDQYNELKKFQSRLLQAEQDEDLQQVITEVVRDKNRSLIEYFSQQILKDPHAKTESFLDIYEYFDFEVYSEEDSGSRRLALRGSGGESTGMKYLIYSLAFHSLRIKGTSPSTLSYAKPLFIFFDEAAAVDERGINTLTELSEKLKINAIIAMVNAPLIHDKRLSDFILANGVITPGYSDIVTAMDLGQKA